MSWEKRNGTTSKYYYRSARVDGRVTKQYVGRGQDPVVQVIAKGDRLDQTEQAASVEEVRREQSEFQELQTLLLTLAKRVHQGLRICLLAEGFRRQKGEWKRMPKTDTKRTSKSSVDDGLPSRERFQHLTRWAGRGDQDAAEELKEIIRNHRDIWDPVGDLTKHAEESLIKMIAQENLVLSESLRVKIEDLRKSLRGESEDETERLLADHIVVTWLEMQFTRMAAIQPQQHIRDARFWDERHERANARYLSTIRELIKLRELSGDVAGAQQLHRFGDR